MIAAGHTDEFDIGPNRNIFYVGFMFLSAGLLSGTIVDFATNIALPSLVFDFITFGVYVVIIAFVRLRIFKYSIALFVLILQSMIVFHVDFYVSYFTSYAGSQQAFSVNAIHNLMVTGLFGAISTLVIDKRAAYGFSAFVVVAVILISILRPEQTYFSNQAVMDVATLIGTLMVVFYYREMLEALMAEIRESLLTARHLKDKAEEFNEINRPFAVFGRNAANLAYDFRTDVEEVRRGIEAVRQLRQDARVPDAELLRNVEQAVRSLNRRIAWVKFATSANEEREAERIALRDVAESAVYPFVIQEDLRGKVSIDLEILAEPRTWGKRLQYLHVVEGIIRGICAGLVERGSVKFGAEENNTEQGRHKQRALLKVTLREADGQALLDFEVDGGPLPVCSNCQKNDCTRCPLLQASTGLPFTQPAFLANLEAIGAMLRFRGKPGAGSLVEMSIPLRDPIVSK